MDFDKIILQIHFYLIFLIFCLKSTIDFDIEDTLNIPTAIVAAMIIVLIPVFMDLSILPCTVSSIVLYIPLPGTNGIRTPIMKVVTGVLSTLAIISEYMAPNMEDKK